MRRARRAWALSAVPAGEPPFEPTAVDAALRAVRFAGRRLRTAPARRDAAAVKLTGIRFDVDASIFFGSLHHLAANVRAIRPRERYGYLVAHNFLTDEFASFAGPKLWYSSEPLHILPQETTELLATRAFDRYLMTFDDADPDRRRYYVTLPDDRRWLVRHRRSGLATPRQGRCCIVNRFASGPGLLGERIRLVDALGDHVDVYGAAPRGSAENGWLRYPTYRGAVGDKLATMERYTFAVVFENSDHPGYVTEKLPHALMAGAVPLYRGGGGLAGEAIPPECFVDCRDREPDEVAELVRTMPFEQVVEYRRAAVEFLSSRGADRLTRAHWVSTIVGRLRAQET